MTGVAADPGKPVAIDPAVEKTFDRFLHDRAHGAILFFVKVGIGFLEFRPVTFQTSIKGRVFGLPLSVSALESHALPTTCKSQEVRTGKIPSS
jgi:hypothetical protein